MDIKEHKKTFQLERIILFSDAVFAISITLLVIELKLPDIEQVTNSTLANALLCIWPHFFSFVLSFMIIGIYWMAHHRMFNFVTSYDNKLIWLNLLFLFFIVLMPFSSNIYGVYAGLNTAFILYVFNISMIALFNFLLYHYISRPSKKLSHGLENPRLVRYFKIRTCIVPASFGIGLIISLFGSSFWVITLSRLSPLLIIIGMRRVKKIYADVAV